MRKFSLTMLSLASALALSGSPAAAFGACAGAKAPGTAHHCIFPCRDFKGECQCPN